MWWHCVLRLCEEAAASCVRALNKTQSAVRANLDDALRAGVPEATGCSSSSFQRRVPEAIVVEDEEPDEVEVVTVDLGGSEGDSAEAWLSRVDAAARAGRVARAACAEGAFGAPAPAADGAPAPTLEEEGTAEAPMVPEAALAPNTTENTTANSAVSSQYVPIAAHREGSATAGQTNAVFDLCACRARRGLSWSCFIFLGQLAATADAGSATAGQTNAAEPSEAPSESATSVLAEPWRTRRSSCPRRGHAHGPGVG